MRILHVRDAANVARFLVRGLSALGQTAELRCPAECAQESLWLKSVTVPRRIMDGLQINAYIRKHEFDVVHLHYGNSGWMGALGRYAYFLHCHGSDVRVDMYRPVRKWLVMHGLRRAGGVFFSTPDLYAHVSPIRPDAVYLPNPIDTRLFRPASNGDHANVRLLINQALKPSKAPEIAFRAARQIKRMFTGVEICAFAYGPELERFRSYDEVRFIDVVPHSRMAQLINSFDIIIGQFGIGSLGVSELESMACGKPVVCYVDEAAYDLWCDEPPPVFSARHAEAVSEAVATLIQQRNLREEAGRKGCKWVERNHDYLRVASRVLSHYHAFLNRGVRKLI